MTDHEFKYFKDLVDELIEKAAHESRFAFIGGLVLGVFLALAASVAYTFLK